MHEQDKTIQRGVTLAHNVLREGQPIDLKGYEVRELSRALLLLYAIQTQTSPVPSDDPIDGPTEIPVRDTRVERALYERDRPKANARQVGGEHYGLSSFQHWDMVDLFELDYFQGQITKYVMRWRQKNGIPDLQKAQHFLEKYIELESKTKPEPPNGV